MHSEIHLKSVLLFCNSPNYYVFQADSGSDKDSSDSDLGLDVDAKQDISYLISESCEAFKKVKGQLFSFNVFHKISNST